MHARETMKGTSNPDGRSLGVLRHATTSEVDDVSFIEGIIYFDECIEI